MKVKLPETTLEAAAGWLFNIGLFTIPFSLLSNTLFGPDKNVYFTLPLLAPFAYLWWRFNCRRPRLTIDLGAGTHCFSWHGNWDTRQGLPYFHVTHEVIDDIALSTLKIGNITVAEHRAPRDSFDESIFSRFIERYGMPVTDNTESTTIANIPSKPTIDLNCSALSSDWPSGRPLIILIHGTWGSRSVWSQPETSSIARAIVTRFPDTFEIERFSWTGRNSPACRREAAERLAEQMIQNLEHNTRPIILISHSHGGNIALAARDMLPSTNRHKIGVVTMGTPFLREGRFFVAKDLLNDVSEDSLPFVSVVVSLALLLGVVSFVALGLHALEQLSALLKSFMGTGETFTRLAVYATTIPCVVYCFWSLAGWIRSLPSRNEEIIHLPDNRTFSISYSQDEAFQAISIIVNLISLTYQAAFAGGHAVFNFLRRWNVLDYVSGAAVLFTALAIYLSVASLGISALWHGLISQSATTGWLLTVLDRLSIDTVVSFTLHYVFVWGFASVVLWAALALVALILIGILCLFRFCILYLIGIADLARTRPELLGLIVGSLSVSMVPEGNSKVFQLVGSSVFNHTQIYNDERAIDGILAYLAEVVDGR